MHDERTRLSQDVERELRDHFPDLVFRTVIPRSVRVAEAPSYGLAGQRPCPDLARRRSPTRALAEEIGERGMSARRGMGRGPGGDPARGRGEAPAELRELPVELIRPNPNQPRTRFDPEALDALAASIEASGVVQPLLVRPLTTAAMS